MRRPAPILPPTHDARMSHARRRTRVPAVPARGRRPLRRRPRVRPGLPRAAGGRRRQARAAVRRQARSRPSRPTGARCSEHALQLAARTRDLRRGRLADAQRRTPRPASPARCAGLQLVHGLLERTGTTCIRSSTPATTTTRPRASTRWRRWSHLDAGLADLRAASLTGKRGGLTVRDIELALGHAEPLTGEAVPTEDGVLQGVAAALAQPPEPRRARCRPASTRCKASPASSSSSWSAAQAPDLAPLQEAAAARRRSRPRRAPATPTAAAPDGGDRGGRADGSRRVGAHQLARRRDARARPRLRMDRAQRAQPIPRRC